MKYFILFMGCMLYGQVPAQVKKINSIVVHERIQQVAVDRPGDFYLLFESGRIEKYDRDGNTLRTYDGKEPVTLFDPRDGAHPMAYLRERQECQYFNPALEITRTDRLDSAVAIRASLACPSGDHNLWVLDLADMSLKKVISPTSQIAVEIKINQAQFTTQPDFTFMREYQNFVFLLDKKSGILIFNNLGKQIKAVSVTGLRHFNFIGEELYYLHQGRLQFMDLFTSQFRELALPVSCEMALVTDERLLTVNSNQVDIFEMHP